MVVAGIVGVLVVVSLLSRRRSEDAAPPEDPELVMAEAAPTVRPLVEWLCERAAEETGTAVRSEPIALRRIVEAAETAVEDLRTHDTTKVKLPFLAAGERGPVHFETTVERTTCEELGALR